MEGTAMNVIVTDRGFSNDPWTEGFVPFSTLAAGKAPTACAVDLPSKADPALVAPHFDRIALIRIRLEDFTDMGGFALAHSLRSLGYGGRLRAWGNVLAHQYTLARRAGFDEVEICAQLAARQPEEHWQFRGNWQHARFGSRMQVPADGARRSQPGPSGVFLVPERA